MNETSLPVGGENTHTVLTGHRGLPSALMFTHLDKIEKKDIFYIHTLDKSTCLSGRSNKSCVTK